MHCRDFLLIFTLPFESLKYVVGAKDPSPFFAFDPEILPKLTR
jgi:hypothetical protein